MHKICHFEKQNSLKLSVTNSISFYVLKYRGYTIFFQQSLTNSKSSKIGDSMEKLDP